MQNNGIEILIIALAVMAFILLCLIGVLVVLKLKSKAQEKESVIEETNENSKTKVQQSHDIKSIFNFMEFDKIEDNMIVQKKGKRFLMVIKCKGINYDLMSGVEKTSVEQGFSQYLNTLRYPIQIYVQTRTVDLGSSINTYKQKINKIGDDLARKEFDYNQKIRSGQYPSDQLLKERFELVKLRNLYEYGIDVVKNTETMSLNKNILSKEYYIIIPYYPDELNTENYAKEEISNAAFSELYTRAQSTISLLSVCGINGKILDSIELANLLYMAYNRDEAEIYSLEKAINSGFDEMYTTAPSVLDRKMKELDKQIEQEAIRKANEAVLQVRQESEKEKQLKEKEKEFNNLIAKMSKMILENNKEIIGNDIAKKAKEKIDEESEEKIEEESKEKGGKQNEKKQNKKVGRPKKSA